MGLMQNSIETIVKPTKYLMSNSIETIIKPTKLESYSDIISKKSIGYFKEPKEDSLKLKSNFNEKLINIYDDPFKKTYKDKFLLNETYNTKEISKQKESTKILLDTLIKSNNINIFSTKIHQYKTNFNQSGLSKFITITPESVEELLAIIPQEVKGKTDIAELSMHAKRVLLRVVSKLNTRLFDRHFENLPILPTNKEQYCYLMRELAKAASVEVLPVSEKSLHQYYSAMQSLEDVLPKTDIASLHIQLQMPRRVFVERAQIATSKLSDAEKRKVFDHFGFEIRDGKMSGYPVDMNTPAEEITNHVTKSAFENIRGIVNSFTQENKIILPPEQKPLEDALNDVIKVFPEFITTIGKQQHGTHTLTLDKHLLKVLQETMSHPEYKNLAAEDKKVFNIAVLLHDIAKTEGEVDKAHPFESAIDLSSIVTKMDLSLDEQERVVNMVKNHHWLEELSHVEANDETALKNVAFCFRKPNDLLMAKIFAEGDLKGVSDDFYQAHKHVLTSTQIQKVEKYLSDIYKTGIYLPQTHIPKASQIKMINPTKLGQGEQTTTNVVVNLAKHHDLTALGFDNPQLQTLVHVFRDYEVGTATLKELEKETNEGVLSTSFIDRSHFGTYYGNGAGVLLDHDPTNIIQAGTSNLGSGCKKDLKNQILAIFDSSRSGNNSLSMYSSNARTYFASKVKAELHLSDDEYAKLYQQLLECPNLDSFPNQKFKNAIQNVLKDYMKQELGHNEITVLAPKIKGIFLKGQSVNSLPYEIRKFAQDNDLPIIIFGN